MELGIKNGRDFVTRGRQPEMPIYGMQQYREYSSKSDEINSDFPQNSLPDNICFERNNIFAYYSLTRSDWKIGQQFCISSWALSLSPVSTTVPWVKYRYQKKISSGTQGSLNGVTSPFEHIFNLEVTVL